MEEHQAEDPLLSVVVPVYKAERYLAQCIESILGQSFRNFELILIDDGSPDSSGAICDEYAAKDRRVRVFHQGNRGIAKTRERGIALARGTYLIWVDSDDFIDEGLFAAVAAAHGQTGADIVLYGWRDLIGDAAVREKHWDARPTAEWQREVVTGRRSCYLWNCSCCRIFWGG